ncbi:hypothetical protein LOTGIDRAFT_165486 [Lottia gigantea]|uniref:Mutator-like transposase domain-containing protein n=1 Tax=Lottia gigantea TaxID=225164 RepID=V3ZCB3_LOTGI|nr:hypothetical protein LOTGIDRAFT_165486 [Lottia gigantea]ESO88698.1 hypothetical protein LOTGIDRAFT_165486 [Lottia gigantea]
MGRIIGEDLSIQGVLIKFATRDGDSTSATGIEEAMRTLHPMWKIEKLADPAHLSASQFHQCCKANLSHIMFRGKTNVLKTNQKKTLSQDIKSRMPKRNRSYVDEDDIVPTTAEDRLTNIMLQKMLRRGLLLNTAASSTSQSPTSAVNSSTVQSISTTTFQTTQASPSTNQNFPEAMEMVTSVESIPVNSQVLHSSVAETVSVTNALDPSPRLPVPSVNNQELILYWWVICLIVSNLCQYMHVCSKCGFNHAAINCFAKRTRQQSQPQSPQADNKAVAVDSL